VQLRARQVRAHRVSDPGAEREDPCAAAADADVERVGLGVLAVRMPGLSEHDRAGGEADAPIAQRLVHRRECEAAAVASE
jgi:hypothetical protein